MPRVTFLIVDHQAAHNVLRTAPNHAVPRSCSGVMVADPRSGATVATSTDRRSRRTKTAARGGWSGPPRQVLEAARPANRLCVYHRPVLYSRFPHKFFGGI